MRITAGLSKEEIMADLDKRSFGREEGKCLVCEGSEENGERDTKEESMDFFKKFCYKRRNGDGRVSCR